MAGERWTFGMTKREPKLLRISAAAHELGLHPITVRRWIKAGRIQAVPMGREVRVPRSEVERLRSEEHTSELQSLAYLVCRLLLEKKKKQLISHFSYKKKHKTGR